MASRFIAGLDIGTTSIKAVVLEQQDRKLLPRHAFKMPSLGMRKGVVVDIAEVSQSVNRALFEIKKLSKSALRRVYVSIGTHQVRAQASRGIVAVSRSDTEIYQEDVSRVMKASQAVNLGPNRMIVHQVNREFIVDGVGDIVDPIGLSGNRLEVNSLIVDAFSPHVKSVIRIVELGGGDIGGLVFAPIAAARAALSKTQKDLGVVMVDIGGGTTGLAVFEENKLLAVSKFPIGAGNISNDLAVGLKIPVDAAENLKLHYGHALAREVGTKETIELKKFSPEAKGSVSRRFVAEIIESRLAEIFDFVNNELKLFGKFGELPGGVVFVGGGAKLPGLTELARQEMKLSSQIGLVAADEWDMTTEKFLEQYEDPEYVTAFGLALWGVDQESWSLRGLVPRLSVRGVLRYFLP